MYKEAHHSTLLDQMQKQWPESTSLETEIVFALSLLNDLIQDQMDQVLSVFELNRSNFEVLILLRTQPDAQGLMPTQICETLSITSGGMTKILVNLEKRDLIVRIPMDIDKRGKLVRLTTKGYNLAENSMAAITKRNRDLIQRLLPTEDLNSFQSLLTDSLTRLVQIK